MSKRFKLAVLDAFKNGYLSKVEAKVLFESKGRRILNLSSGYIGNDVQSLESIISKVSNMEKHFINIIDLGKGVEP